MSKAQIWSKEMVQARKKRRPPIAPSESEREIYEKFLMKAIKRKRNPKALVLGITPELREMALKNNCQVVSVDISKDTIGVMKDLVRHKYTEKEIIIQDNWLTVPLEENSFDLVMGDASFTNLSSFGDAKRLLAKIKRVLKPGGHLLIRELVHLPKRKSSFQKAVNNYRKGKIKWADFYMEHRFYIFFDEIYNPKTKLLSTAKVFQKIKKKYRKRELTKQEFQSFKGLPSKVKNLILLKSEFEKLVSKNFSIVSIKKGKEFDFCRYLPIYFCRVKK